MAQASFYSVFNKFLILGLMIFSILAFAVITESENNVSDPFIESNPVVNGTYFTLREDLASFRDESQTQKSLFESENPTVGFGTILLFSIVSAGKIFNSMIVSIFNTLIKLPVVILGVDPVLISVFSAILILSIILGLWAVYKLGS